jgi:gas vesicle protein
MRHRTGFAVILTTLLLISYASMGSAQSRRLTDDQVKKLMEDVEKDVERFTKAIEPKYRTATIRSATSEVSIEAFLTDLKKGCENMRDRFKDDYGASNEVLQCLRNAATLDRRASSGGGLYGGEKEWPRLKGTSQQLAKAYGIDWAAGPDSWTSRRVNDREAVKVIEALPAHTDSFKKGLENALQHVEGVNKDEQKKAFEAIDRLKDVSGDLKDAVEDGRDAAGHLGIMRSATKDIQGFLGKYGLASSVGSVFRPLDAQLVQIASLFS